MLNATRLTTRTEGYLRRFAFTAKRNLGSLAFLSSPLLPKPNLLVNAVWDKVRNKSENDSIWVNNRRQERKEMMEGLQLAFKHCRDIRLTKNEMKAFFLFVFLSLLLIFSFSFLGRVIVWSDFITGGLRPFICF